jgi:hypothetical protein
LTGTLLPRALLGLLVIVGIRLLLSVVIVYFYET